MRSKTWGCRSKTLTPTPEPARYCAGDVAGERGGRAACLRRLESRGSRRFSFGRSSRCQVARGWGRGSVYRGQRPPTTGHAGVREWWDAVHEPWDYFKSHVQRTFVGGDKVVTVVRFEAKGKQSGAEVELPFLTNVMELKDGLVVEFNSYYSLEEALGCRRPVGAGRSRRLLRFTQHREALPREPHRQISRRDGARITLERWSARTRHRPDSRG